LTSEQVALRKTIDTSYAHKQFTLGKITEEQYTAYVSDGYPSDSDAELKSTVETLESQGVTIKDSLKRFILS
jgi:hypothetical protein